MVYGALKYISKQIYIPRAISLKNKNLVALDNALSLDSSHVLGWESLKPLAGIEWVDPPVVKYSLELSVVVVVMEAAAAAANVGFKSDELVDKYFKVELVNNLVDLVDEDVIICLNIVVISCYYCYWLLFRNVG